MFGLLILPAHHSYSTNSAQTGAYQLLISRLPGQDQPLFVMHLRLGIVASLLRDRALVEPRPCLVPHPAQMLCRFLSSRQPALGLDIVAPRLPGGRPRQRQPEQRLRLPLLGARLHPRGQHAGLLLQSQVALAVLLGVAQTVDDQPPVRRLLLLPPQIASPIVPHHLL